jgi:hypothetical protein
MDLGKVENVVWNTRGRDSGIVPWSSTGSPADDFWDMRSPAQHEREVAPVEGPGRPLVATGDCGHELGTISFVHLTTGWSQRRSYDGPWPSHPRPAYDCQRPVPRSPTAPSSPRVPHLAGASRRRVGRGELSDTCAADPPQELASPDRERCCSERFGVGHGAGGTPEVHHADADPVGAGAERVGGD